MLVLASASPRRLQLLQQIKLNPQVMPADIDESRNKNELAVDYVQRLAKEKASIIAERLTSSTIDRSISSNISTSTLSHSPSKPFVLAADTIVSLNEMIFPKPESQQQAIEYWQQLSDKTHQVLTAMTVIHNQQVYSALSKTEVVFEPLIAQQMQQYWQTGEPLGKAGGYAIQGQAAAWVREIKGSYSGVMGLDLYLCNKLLQQAGFFDE